MVARNEKLKTLVPRDLFSLPLETTTTTTLCDLQVNGAEKEGELSLGWWGPETDLFIWDRSLIFLGQSLSLWTRRPATTSKGGDPNENFVPDKSSIVLSLGIKCF